MKPIFKKILSITVPILFMIVFATIAILESIKQGFTFWANVFAGFQGAILGIVIGGFCFLLILIVGNIILMIKNKKKQIEE